MAEKLTSLAKRLRPFINGQVGAIASTGAYMQEGPGIDLVGNKIGLSGDSILLYKSNGDPIAEYPATEAGINSAFAAAVAGNVIVFPDNIVIAVTAGKSMPAGVSVTGANLSFSGFAGTAITMTTGSDLSNFNIAYNGAGQVSAKGVYANAVQCNVSNGRALVYDATTNVGLDLKGNNTGGLRINAQNLTGECYGGTTNHGITIRDHVAARDIYAEVHDNNAIGLRTEISSLEVDDWIIGGWGNAPSGTTAYGVQVASGAARLIGVNCSGNDSGLRIESGATAYTFGCRATAISNAGTIVGETFVDSTSLYIDDEAQFYGEAGGNVTLRSIDNNNNTKLLITPKGTPAGGDTALHLYASRTSEGAADELFLGIGASHGGPVYLFGTGDATNHGNMLDILFFTENGVVRTDVMRLDAAGWMTFLKHFDVEEIAAPANPPANTARVYSRDDSGTTKLYYKRSDGTEIELGGGSGGDVVGPAGATDGAWALFDGVTGKLLKDGGLPTLNNLSDVDTTGVGTGDIIYKTAGNWEDYPLGIGTKITTVLGKLKFGDADGTDYVEIDAVTGNLRLLGKATAWEDLRVSASVAKPGATAPSYKTFGPSGNLQALMFEAGHHDEVFFEVQLPHAWKQGSNIYPHVHWTPTDTTAGNVVWELEYSWANINGTFGAPSNMATDATAAGGTAWVHKLTQLKSGGNAYIDGTGKTFSSMIMCRLHRNSNSGSDTLNKDVALLEIDFHYEVDSFGSDEEYVKDAQAALLLETGDYLLLETGDKLLME